MKISFYIFLSTLNLGFSLLCNRTGTVDDWFCPKNFTNIPRDLAAVVSDSCFCLLNKIQTQQDAFNSCSELGGFLTDIQDSNENDLMLAFLLAVEISDEFANELCGPNGMYFNGSCYVFNPKLTKTWQNAEAYCQKTYSGHLADVKTLEEQQFVFRNLTRNCSSCSSDFGYFVGAQYIGKPQVWTWVDNTTVDMTRIPVTTHAPWGRQPDAPSWEPCMAIAKPDGGWHDFFCWWALPFPCKFDPPIYPSLIGLQKVLSGRVWSIGSNCSPRLAAFQQIYQQVESMTKTAYVFDRDGVWRNVETKDKFMSAICRRDYFICGRQNLCPTCSTCSAINNGTCYRCN